MLTRILLVPVMEKSSSDRYSGHTCSSMLRIPIKSQHRHTARLRAGTTLLRVVSAGIVKAVQDGKRQAGPALPPRL